MVASSGTSRWGMTSSWFAVEIRQVAGRPHPAQIVGRRRGVCPLLADLRRVRRRPGHIPHAIRHGVDAGSAVALQVTPQVVLAKIVAQDEKDVAVVVEHEPAGGGQLLSLRRTRDGRPARGPAERGDDSRAAGKKRTTGEVMGHGIFLLSDVLVMAAPAGRAPAEPGATRGSGGAALSPSDARRK